MAQIHNELLSETNLVTTAIANDQLTEARKHLVTMIRKIDTAVGTQTVIAEPAAEESPPSEHGRRGGRRA